jgi:NodT family efflux transporter outer membrane factor (OMF) lipoprotein
MRMNRSGELSNTKRVKHVLARAIVCGMLLVLPSCGICPLRLAQPGPALPTTFNGEASPANSAQLAIKEFFNDPLLTHLIDQALAGNQELKVLNEEVQVARSVILQKRGAYLPFVGYMAGARLDRLSTFTLPGASLHDDPYLPGKFLPNPLPDFLLSLNLLWQVDIWRELRNARDAAQQRYLSAVERRNYFVTHLVADIAENYYELMALDKRLENLDQIIELQEKSLKISMSRLEFARGNRLAVQRFTAEVRKNQSQKLIVRQDIIQTENKINFLVGRYPQAVERISARFYDLTFPLSVGVPAQLLQYRPDIRQAERELEAAGLDVKVARAHFFPRLDITGGIGYEAFNPKYLFWTPDALIYTIAGGLAGPLINKTAIQAEYLSANAKQLESVYNYQRVILNAFTEVVNRVSKVGNYGRSLAVKRQQVESLVAAVESATQLFNNPRLDEKARVDYLDVLTAQRDLWDARLELIDTRQAQLAAIVNAYQALGGGVPLALSTEGSPQCNH